MPSYLRVSQVPQILASLQGQKEEVFQTQAWQADWVQVAEKPIEGSAVLSYRWRKRAWKENLADYMSWCQGCRAEGYLVQDLASVCNLLWKVVDDIPVQIEVAIWMLYVHATNAAEWIWIDQFCVPQDAPVEIKMAHVRESLDIYRTGKVTIVLAPVVDYITGYIVDLDNAEKLVGAYAEEFYEDRSLAAMAHKALMVNSSYMRRVWTIMEAVVAKDLCLFPLAGFNSSNEVNTYQPLHLCDWPAFNQWNGWEGIMELRSTSAKNEVLKRYMDGDFTLLLKKLQEHPEDGIAYLALVSKEIMWITNDRNGLIQSLRETDMGKKAHAIINSHQILAARSYIAEDKVLALVPLLGYHEWLEATKDSKGQDLVQDSFTWAYNILEEHQWGGERWSLRTYISHDCNAAALDSWLPRRNFHDISAMHGAKAGVSKYSVESASLTLSGADAISVKVRASGVMTHPGDSSASWSGGPWTELQQALSTPGCDIGEGLRLSLEWAAEMWLESDVWSDSLSVVLLTDEAPHVLVVIIPPTEQETSALQSGKLMMVLDVPADAVDDIEAWLTSARSAEIFNTFEIVSVGVPVVAVEPAAPIIAPLVVMAVAVPAADQDPAAAGDESAADEAKPVAKASDMQHELPNVPFIQKGGHSQVVASGIETAAGHGEEYERVDVQRNRGCLQC